MKVYLRPPFDSRGVQRVVDALIRHLPDELQVTDYKYEADFVIVHAIGRAESIMREIDDLGRRKIPYAIVQYALRSTMKPSTRCWINVWERAEVVWSYYNLKQLCAEDNTDAIFTTYHSPLGTDWSRFHNKVEVEFQNEFRNHFNIATCSLSYLTESVRECIVASKEINARVFHLGNNVKRDNAYCVTGINDDQLAYLYSHCRYVSGLRRIEGFELPAVEGLFCGARPIMFDQPHYRQWFDKWALFIPEGDRQQVVDSLISIFKQPYRPVTLEEIAEARQLFDWQTIIKGFWEYIL